MNSVPLSSASDFDTAYRRNQVKSVSFLILLTVLLCDVFLLSVCSGSYDTPLGELVKGIFGMSADRKINLVVQNNRPPRICTAILAGRGLGITGCVLQSILRNPLASASTLGVSQGASSPAANGRRRFWPGHWLSSRRCCFWTNQRVLWTFRTSIRYSRSSGISAKKTGSLPLW